MRNVGPLFESDAGRLGQTIRDLRLSASETAALTGGSTSRARIVAMAERSATRGYPRSDVIDRLRAIAEAGGG